LTPSSSNQGEKLPLQTAAVTVRVVPECGANAGREDHVTPWHVRPRAWLASCSTMAGLVKGNL
jgi:hypothetical protein